MINHAQNKCFEMEIFCVYFCFKLFSKYNINYPYVRTTTFFYTCVFQPGFCGTSGIREWLPGVPPK